MQIIAHATELMKYDLRPGGSTTTTTTLRPTPSHKPGLYSPIKPLGPEVYFAKTNAFNEYLQRLKNGGNYFDRYSLGVESREESRAYNSYLPSEEELKALSKFKHIEIETFPNKMFYLFYTFSNYNFKVKSLPNWKRIQVRYSKARKTSLKILKDNHVTSHSPKT